MLRATGVAPAARPWLLLLASALLVGCFGGSALGPPVQDEAALAFSARASRFYRFLEAVPIDALITYENPELHGFFAGEAAFADYYSALVNQIRAMGFRDERLDRLEILEFRFDGSDRASVDLRIEGQHQRALRFWGIELLRRDTWLRVDGVWLLSPEKL